MAESQQRRMWQTPAWGANKNEMHAFLIQNVEDGQAFMELEPGYQQLEESIRILTATPNDKLAAKQADGRYSNLVTKRLKRNLREMVATLSDITFLPGFHSDAEETQGQAEILNRISYWWWYSSFADVKIKKAVQWMAIGPRGWVEICYRRNPGKRGEPEIDLIARPFSDVVMTGVPENGDHQEAYTVSIIKDTPVYQAHYLWPDAEKQGKLVPDRETPKGWREKLKTVANIVFAAAPEKKTGKNPTVRLIYQYILDLSVNKSGKTVKMGYDKTRVIEDGKMIDKEVATPWSYDVPSVGSFIKSGYDVNGTPQFRMATEEDCKMFPNRRLAVGTEKDCIYDGTAFDMHGMVPVIKLTADSWPFGDFSMVSDVASIQDTINEVMRVTHQTVRNRFNPSMMYDVRAMNRTSAKAFRTDISGQRVGFNGQASNGDPMKPALPQAFYTIEGWIYDFLKHMEDAMDYQMGVHDITAMAKMKAAGDEETLQKMAELAGPIVKSISRDMERSMRDLSEMFKYYVFQYMNVGMILPIVGAEGATPESFKYEPGNLIPMHLPGENVKHPSVFTLQQRAHYIAKHLPFLITPNTLHRLNQTSQKLMILQLWRGGFPIDPWTLSDVMGLPNFGKKPEGTNDMLTRFAAYKDMESSFAAAEQKKLTDASQVKTPEQLIFERMTGTEEPNDGLAPTTPAVNRGASSMQGTGPKGGFLGHSGRAPTAQRAPKLEQKGDGRQIVRESP